MSRPRLLPLLAALALAAGAGAARAAAYRSGAIEAVDPWSRPAVQGLTGVGYMTLANRGRRPDALVAVTSPMASKVEIHRSAVVGGVMTMAAQPRVAIPPGGEVSFAPGAYHLMFVGLKANLKPGDSLPATLVFADGRRLPLAFAVGTGVEPPHLMTKK